jgi:hypothetical protein
LHGREAGLHLTDDVADAKYISLESAFPEMASGARFELLIFFWSCHFLKQPLASSSP